MKQQKGLANNNSMDKVYKHWGVLLLILITYLDIAAQKKNSYKFIEPNISISYDSNFFKLSNRYLNSVYETEAYDFVQIDTLYNVRIHINAGHPVDYPSLKIQDSLILDGLREARKVSNDTFSIINSDSYVRTINGFKCAGFVAYNKENKEYGTFIGGYHFSKNDNTEVRYYSSNRNDLDKEYTILSAFLSQFKSYSKVQIDKEEKLIRSKYSAIIKPTKTIDTLPLFKKNTYTGIVSVKQKLEHKILEVRLNLSSYSQQIFIPNKKNQVLIESYDTEKGKVVKKGELIMLNSFGKKVKIPFTFSYINNGTL